MQLLPGDKISISQVPGERFRNELPNLLRRLVHIKCNSESFTLWALHAFILLSGMSCPFKGLVTAGLKKT